MFKKVCTIALTCFLFGCNSRPAVPGERCFTPDNSFLTDITEVCEIGKKTDRTCSLRYRNGEQKSIACKQVDAMKKVSGAGL